VSLASLPALAAGSNTIGAVQLTDGSTTANNVAGDTGQNALVTTRGRKEVAFTTTTAQALASTDVSNYSWVCVHTTSQGTSSSVAFQGSNDNTNWVGVNLLSVAAAGAALPSVATGSVSMYAGPLPCRYFRVNVTGISAGTTAGVIEFLTQATPALTNNLVLASGTNTIGNVGLAPQTTGGLSSVKVISAASNNATLVKSTAGQVYNIQAFNTATSVRYLKLYNKTSAPAPATDTGSTVLLASYLIPANGSGLVVEISNGMAFSAGIGLAVVTGMADSDNTSTGASEVIVNVQYK
jgi:hypothetical protein